MSKLGQRLVLPQRHIEALRRRVQDAIADPEMAFKTSTKFVEGLGSDPQKDAIQKQVLAETVLENRWLKKSVTGSGSEDDTCG